MRAWKPWKAKTPLKQEFGRPIEIAKKGFGGKKEYEAAIAELEKAIYDTTPNKSAWASLRPQNKESEK